MILKSDIFQIKENYATAEKVQGVQMELENLKLASVVNPHVNTGLRGAYM